MTTKKIAVAGKGGTGKTTFTALLIKELIRQDKGEIIAVDADPNSNLNEALGLEVKETIADILDEVKSGKTVPEGMPKDVFVEWRLNQILTESPDVDLIVMGIPQGSGCYCFPNDLMRKYLESLKENYEYIVMDNEAGMEHLSRKIVTGIDALFVVSDSSARAVRSAGRVHEIVKTVGIDVKDIYLVVTKTLGEDSLIQLSEEIEKTGLKLIGDIPYDEAVVKQDLAGKALSELGDESKAVLAVREIIKKANL